MSRPRAPLAVALILVGSGLSGCSGGMDVWDRPYVAAHRSPPLADLPPPRHVAHAPSPVALPPRAPEPVPAPAPVAAPAAPRGEGPTTEDLAIFEEVNRMRASRRLRPFHWDPKLFQAALDHSKEQDRHHYMGHGSPDPRRDDLGDRVKIAGYRARAWAEVVAWGYTGPAHVVQGWMDSKGHREILTDPSLVDAGFSRVGDYFTGDFGTPMPVAAPVLRSCAPAPSH